MTNFFILLLRQAKRADLEEKLQRRDTEIMKGDDEIKDMSRKLQDLNLVMQGLQDELKQKNDRFVNSTEISEWNHYAVIFKEEIENLNSNEVDVNALNRLSANFVWN